jgi:hypothetical protein
MTGKERLLAALAGEKPDRVPFAPNIWQWYHVNDYNGTLPPELSHAGSPVAVLRSLGADIFSKFDGLLPTPVYRDCGHTVTFTSALPQSRAPWASFTTFDQGLVRQERLETPYGALTHTWEYRVESGAPFEAEHWWKDFDSEYPAIRHWQENTVWPPDPAALRAGLDNVGEDGLIIFQLLPSPLKQFHWLAGQAAASYFITDHPQEMAALARLHEQKSLEYLEAVVDQKGVWVFELGDNLDSLFYPPRWFRQFCLPVLQKAAGMIHARGKYLFIHACGKLKALAPLFVEAQLDCVEGQAAPPLGDWRLSEARALSNRLIVCGGMAAPEQEFTGLAAAAHLDSYVRTLFASMGDRRRFIFASSCNTSPRTPYENLLAFREACWRYGAL